ncbi:DeoR/GlpR family DNA-binding transcription regulator [Thioclava atlantica]|uniref:Cro/CI family transcriptional regulator-like protein n=1 Tax=Thioclava atlantica TaxID=1317124 RepID=A0A085TU09_9RHOB|nr:DeoR/GlpR family DNA-binding transcription regulator [Thioclava atlantica]KFE34206.1 Cro/CI family transcriptional regulator -like protein [Thioclava atlantica]
MTFTFSDRQRQILDEVRRAGQVSIESFAQIFGVSPQTIRRDVNELCAAGALRRVHGGVEMPQSENLLYSSRRTLNGVAKRKIGAAFAARIPSGASLSVSIGTSPEYAIGALEAQSDLMVLTNNLNIALSACEREGWTVRVPEGAVRAGDRDILGPQVEEFFARYQVDFGVFGVGGVAEDGTLLDFTEAEVAARMAILRNCRRSVLLLDRTKFGRPAHVRGGHMREVDEVICDGPLPAPIAADLAAAGVTVSITEDMQ